MSNPTIYCFPQDVAQLIIERPTIMAPVLDKGLTGQETYQALLRLYTIALQQAVDMQEGNFSWVSLHAKKVSLISNILTDNMIQKRISSYSTRVSGSLLVPRF